MCLAIEASVATFKMTKKDKIKKKMGERMAFKKR